jgi:hypothetical protein
VSITLKIYGPPKPVSYVNTLNLSPTFKKCESVLLPRTKRILCHPTHTPQTLRQLALIADNTRQIRLKSFAPSAELAPPWPTVNRTLRGCRFNLILMFKYRRLIVGHIFFSLSNPRLDLADADLRATILPETKRTLNTHLCPFCASRSTRNSPYLNRPAFAYKYLQECCRWS